MGHHHPHNHSNKNLKVAFFLNVAFTIIEVFAGMYVNSMAIIADAIHDMGDSLSLGTAWYLQNKSNKAPNKSIHMGTEDFLYLGH